MKKEVKKNEKNNRKNNNNQKCCSRTNIKLYSILNQFFFKNFN